MKENKCWKIIYSSPLLLSASAPLFSSFFYFCFPRCCYAPALFFFSLGVLPFIFLPKILSFFQPKRFSAFQPKNTFFFSAQTFFSPKHFCFSPKLFSVQPKTLFIYLFIYFLFSVQSLFSSSFFLLYSFLVQPSFFFFFLFFSSVYPRPNILSSCFTSLLFE